MESNLGFGFWRFWESRAWFYRWDEGGLVRAKCEAGGAGAVGRRRHEEHVKVVGAAVVVVLLTWRWRDRGRNRARVLLAPAWRIFILRHY